MEWFVFNTSSIQDDLNDARNGWDSAVAEVIEIESQRDELLKALKLFVWAYDQAGGSGSIEIRTAYTEALGVIAKAEGAK